MSNTLAAFFALPSFLLVQPCFAEGEGPEEPLVASECLISKEGIAGVHPGDTLKMLKEKVAKISEDITLEQVDQYMVDFSAVAVRRGSETLFYAVFFDGEHKDADAKIEMLETDNPRFRTMEGVGPGTLIVDAAKMYGAPVFAFHTENESREGVTFSGEKAPPRNLSFVPGKPSLGYGFAGDFDGKGADGYVETKEYHPFAFVRRIGVTKAFE